MIVAFKDIEDMRRALKGAAVGRKTLQSGNEVYFDSLQSFRNFMTLQKLELLAMISYQKPTSIYGLANIVGRPLAAVQRDCQMLESIGFIKLQKQRSGRGSHRPMLAFSYDRIVVQIPGRSYALRIEAA